MTGIEIIGLMAAGAAFVALLIEFGKKIHRRVWKLENVEALTSDLSYFVHASS